MAYSKAKLKSNGDRASPCFNPFLIGNISDKFLPTRTLLYVSVRHIFTSLTSFLGIPNSRRILLHTGIITAQMHLILDLPVLYRASLTYVIKQHKAINVFVHREDILMAETGRNCVNALIQYHTYITDIVFRGLFILPYYFCKT